MSNITFSYLFRLFMRRILLIAVVAVLCAVIAFGYCHWLATPIYSAKSQLIVSNGAVIEQDQQQTNQQLQNIYGTNSDKINASDITASAYIASVCVGILQTPDIYSQLSAKLDGEYSKKQLKNSISISLIEEGSIFINIVVSSASKNDAVKIANGFAELAPDYLSYYLPLVNSKITELSENAVLSSPKTFRTTILTFLASAAIMYVILLIFELSDQAIKDEADFSTTYNIPIIGVVPDFENQDAMSQGGGYANAAR